jgi:hypothetical protein
MALLCRVLQVQYYLRATGTEDLVVAPTLDIDGMMTSMSDFQLI